MEKIKSKTDVEIDKLEDDEPLYIVTEVEPRQNVEKEKFKKDWDSSPFNDPAFLEQISEEVEAIEKDYEYSEEELKNMQKLINQLTGNLWILEAGIRQTHPETTRDSALKTTTDLMSMARMVYIEALNSLRKIISRNIEPIIQSVENNSPSQKYAKILLLDIVRKNPDSTDKILPVFKKHIETRAEKGELDPVDVKIIDYLCLGSKKETIINQYIIDHYIKGLQEYFERKPNDYNMILACINAENLYIQYIGRNQISKILKEYEFEQKEIKTIINKWIFAGGSDKYMPEAFAQNVETMKSIEKERPGIAKFLMSNFGMYNFGRYPEKLLIKQYDEYENQNMPYGVAVFAEDDYNAAYFEYKDQLEKLAKELENGYTIRIAEVGGKKDLMRLMVKLRLKYGQKHKISFGILGAHGNEDAITMGNVDNIKDREIRTIDVIEYGNRKYKFFEENGTLILIICLTGEKGAIGSKVSKTMDVKTIAPEGASGLESIKTTLNKSGNLKFKVKYSHHVRASTFKPRKNKTRNYLES